MQPRKTPRQVPTKPHYLTIDLLDMGPTSWRIPSMAKTARILGLLQSSGVLEAAANAVDGEDVIARLGDRVPMLFSCQGALLGLCWFSKSQDLETPAANPREDLSIYGEKVYEELHEDGWEMGQIQTCFNELVGRVVQSFVSQKEVAEKVDFLAPTPEEPN